MSLVRAVTLRLCAAVAVAIPAPVPDADVLVSPEVAPHRRKWVGPVAIKGVVRVDGAHSERLVLECDLEAKLALQAASESNRLEWRRPLLLGAYRECVQAY